MNSTSFTPMLMFFIVLLQSKPCQSQVFFKDKKLHKVWVSLDSKSSDVTGILYEIKDSSILVSNSYYRKNYIENKYNTQDFQINDIKKIKVLESNNYLEGNVWCSPSSGIRGSYCTC